MNLKRNTLMVLVIIFLFHLLANFYILNKVKILRKYDEADRIRESIEFYRYMVNKDYRELIRSHLIVPSYHPKLFPLTGGLVLILLDEAGFKNINFMILFTNAIFLFILLISVYKIGAFLYNKETGLLSAFLLSFSPIIFDHSRIYMLDFPLTAMISLCFLALLKTENFKSLFFSLLTGVLFSLAQLTKESAIIFILPPFLYYSFKSLYNSRGKKRITNLILCLISFSIITGLVYFNPYTAGIWKTYWGKSFLIDSGQSIIFYIKCLFLFYLGIIFSVALFPLLLSYIFNIRKRNFFLSLCFFCPLLIFSLSPNKDARFLLPILPPLYLLLGSEIFNPGFLKIRKIYIGILIFSSFFQYSLFNFFPHSGGDRYSFFRLLSLREDKDFYLVGRLLEVFKEENVSPNKENKIIFTFDWGIHCALQNELMIRDLPFFIDVPQQADVVDSPPPGVVNWQEYLLTADYVVDKTGDLGNRGAREDIGGEFKKSLEINYKMFERIKSFKIRNGDFIYVYKKVKHNDSNLEICR